MKVAQSDAFNITQIMKNIRNRHFNKEKNKLQSGKAIKRNGMNYRLKVNT